MNIYLIYPIGKGNNCMDRLTVVRYIKFYPSFTHRINFTARWSDGSL